VDVGLVNRATTKPFLVYCGELAPRCGQAWAGKSLEYVDKSLFFTSDPCKVCYEWNL
jgi:hypothetical protein